ncbi:MAG: hypothetical protein PHZ00_05280 [Candidatus Peribacteraceae bacterium]|nr:hypothetical protein [Candidatus Peribacteraceae bacterium]
MLCFHRRGSLVTQVLLGIVVAVVLIGIMVFVINPARQFREARDAQRMADIETIIDAIVGYARDNDNRLPFPLTVEPTPICRSGVNLNCGQRINLNFLTGAYLTAIPADPEDATAISTAYTLTWDGVRITVAAPFAEQVGTIAVERIVKGKNP